MGGGAGPVFTPFEVSRMMAEMLIGDYGPTIQEKGYLTVQEPASGGWGDDSSAGSGHAADKQIHFRAIVENGIRQGHQTKKNGFHADTGGYTCMGIGGQGYPSLWDGESFKKALHSKDNQSFLDSWALRSAIWGARHGVGDALDRYMGLHTPTVSSGFANQLAEMGMDDLIGKQTEPLGYNNILKLDNAHIRWKDLSFKRFKDTVSKNTYEFRQALKPGQGRSFFAEVSPKAYARETLWKSNVKPFKDLLSGSKQNLFMNMGYTVGLGLSGASVIKTGVQHYHHWQAKEDGSLASQMQTAYETGKAACQKAIQAFASWEAASIGMAVGRALLPVGVVPIGGILVGALFATTAYKVVGKLFPSLAKLDSSER